VLTETGVVSAGEFSGDGVVETFTAANPAFLDFATVLTITPL